MSRGKEGDSTGTLRARLFAGRNLFAADLNGKSDPYVRFEIGGTRTKFKKKSSTLNPDWYQTKDIPLASLESATLQISVYDHDLIGKDELLGTASVNISSLVPETESFFIVPLEGGIPGVSGLSSMISGVVKSQIPGDDTPHNHGTIAFGLTFHPAKPPAIAKQPKAKHPIVGGQSYELALLVVGAANLNSTDLGSGSDPYCKIEIGSNVFKTKKKSKTSNPIWLKSFSLAPAPLPASLKITVKDHDLIGGNDSVGSAEIPFETLNVGENILLAQLVGGDLGENLGLVAEQVAGAVASNVATEVAKQKGGALAGAVTAQVVGEKSASDALSVQKNYGCVLVALEILER